MAIKTAMCITIAKAQSKLQIASKCRSGRQQVHFKCKTVIILLSTTPPCPIYFSSKTQDPFMNWEEKKQATNYHLESDSVVTIVKLCYYAGGQSMITAESNEDWKESLSYLRSYAALGQDHLRWWHSWQIPSYPCLTALVPVPVQVILFSTNLRNRWFFPLWESLLKTHVTPPAVFDSAQILSIFLQRSCFLYLK